MPNRKTGGKKEEKKEIERKMYKDASLNMEMEKARQMEEE